MFLYMCDAANLDPPHPSDGSVAQPVQPKSACFSFSLGKTFAHATKAKKWPEIARGGSPNPVSARIAQMLKFQFRGISWDFVGFRGISWDFFGVKFFVGGGFWRHNLAQKFRGNFVGFRGISWDFVGPVSFVPGRFCPFSAEKWRNWTLQAPEQLAAHEERASR